MKKILLLLLISSFASAQRNISRLLEQKDSLGRGLISPAQKTAVDLNLLGVGGKNLFNPNNTIDGELVVNSNGSFSQTAGFARTGRIPVSASTTYTLSGVFAIPPNSFAIRFEDASQTLISYRSSSNGGITYPLTFTTPAGCAYVIFTIRHSSYPTTLQNAASRIMLQLGSSADAFEEHIEPLSGRLSSKLNISDIVMSGGKNLFNPSASGVRDGYFLEWNNTEFAHASYGYTDYIQVVPGLTYSGWDGVNPMRKTTYFDALKAVVTSPTSGSTDNVTTFTVPDGVAYVRVTYYLSRKNTFMFEQSSFPTIFQAYSNTKTVVSIGGATVVGGGGSGTSITRTITLAGCERIILLGDSYTEQYNTLPGKGWPAVLSMFVDWMVENYSKGGDNYEEILARIRSNTTTYRSTGINAFVGGGYALLLSFTNDNNDGIINSTDQLNAYVANLKKVISAAKALGYKPVVCTEYHNIGGANGALLMQTTLSKVAAEEGCPFFDVYEVARIARGTDYAANWDGSHMGVRTNGLFAAPILRNTNSLPRPRWGMKVYRKRNLTSDSTVAQLMYNSIQERAEKFKEIYVTQRALADSLFKHYDNQTYVTGKPSQVIGEYLDLMNAGTLSMGNYALIEYIINSTGARTNSLKLYVGNSAATVYVKDVVQQTWVSLTNASGYVTLTNLRAQIDYDKVSILLYNASGITLNAPTIEWNGVEGKDYWVKPQFTESRGAELTATPTVNSLTGWTTSGTVTAADANDSNYPTGSTKVVTLTTSNSIKQTISFSSAPYKRTLQITAYARYNPARYTPGSFPTGAAITLDTYDYPLLKMQVIKSTSTATFTDRVFMHWSPVVFTVDVAAGDTSLDILFTANSTNLEFAQWSARAF